LGPNFSRSASWLPLLSEHTGPYFTFFCKKPNFDEVRVDVIALRRITASNGVICNPLLVGFRKIIDAEVEASGNSSIDPISETTE
jgi:hypothetical protein